MNLIRSLTDIMLGVAIIYTNRTIRVLLARIRALEEQR